MLELLNNLVQGLNAKELELSKEVQKEENTPSYEKKCYIVEYFEAEEIKEELILATNPTNAWIIALEKGLEIKNLFDISNNKKELITIDKLNTKAILGKIEEKEIKQLKITTKATNKQITKVIKNMKKWNLKIKSIKIDNGWYEILFNDTENNYMKFHFTNTVNIIL